MLVQYQTWKKASVSTCTDVTPKIFELASIFLHLDVVEIMKESLYDKYVDEHGFVDFGRSGGMSQQKEAKRFLSALNKQSELQQKDCFSISEIYSLADRIGLRVPDIDTFVDNLNSVGYLLKKGPKTYQVLSSSYSRSLSSR
ncbi:probable DNA helicase MCM8 [Camellia sinensis]|uniref:probable DNA helicase MCM8 n=1 Tax=Camellia sinensis TaxID=4442 RepID=UPI001036CA4C|nr:probable DNA helicase MCM8 [Camellia sinensis]